MGYCTLSSFLVLQHHLHHHCHHLHQNFVPSSYDLLTQSYYHHAVIKTNKQTFQTKPEMKKWRVYHHIFLLPNFLLKRGRLNRNSFKT